MSWFDDVLNFFQSKIDELWASMAPILSAFVKSIISAGGDALLQIAETAINEVMADPTVLTNSAKRDAAIAKVLASAETAGLAVTETAALNAIQAVYTQIKAGDGTLAGQTAPATP